MNILSNKIMSIDLHDHLTHKLLENTFNGNVITMLLNITEQIMKVILVKDAIIFENLVLNFIILHFY